MMRRVLTAAAMLLASSAANAEWVKASSKHFVVYSDDKPEAVRNYTTKLERFDAAVRIALGLKTIEVSPAARVQVFILPSIDDVQRLSRIGGDVAGFYNDNSPMDIYAFVPRRASGDGTEKSLTPQQVLFHEYTHHIMYSSFDGVAIPTWFSEGFAEMFATARIDSEGNVTFGQLPLYRTYGIDMDNVVPAERLVRQGPDYHDSLQTQVFYGRSWLLTDYLMFDHERSKQLAAYITAINSGQSGDQAAKILGVNSTFDLKLNSYGSRSQWPAVTIPADKLAVGDVTVAPLSAGEAAIMPALIRSRNGVDEKQAQTVLAEARRLAAPYPNDPAVQNEMAEAEYDAGDYGASEAAADRALAADPKSIHALIYKGNAQIALLKKASSKDATAWTTARRYFLAANRLDPIYSYPPELYYESFGAEGVKPTPAAINGLLYAYKLRPDLKSLRFEAALAMLRMGNKQGAQVALEPIAYSPHAGSGADLSRKVLDALNKEGTDAALTVLDTAQRDEKKKKPA